jgi:hypothetical protein
MERGHHYENRNDTGTPKYRATVCRETVFTFHEDAPLRYTPGNLEEKMKRLALTACLLTAI